MRVAALLLALCVLGPSAAPREARAAEPKEIVLDRDDIDVTEDVVVKSGVYRVADANGDGVLRVRNAGVKVILDGVTLDGSREGQEPDAFDGVGVSVEDSERVTIRGGAVRGFRVGLRASNSPKVTIDRLDASGNRKQRLKSTPEREDASDWLWPHENDEEQWEKNYGAGLSLTRCPDAMVGSCRVRGGQNGLLLTRCDRSTATLNDFSFNSGWGIALYRTSGCNIRHNRCDWCVRGYSHGVYARGQDSAGFLVFEQCSDNLFIRNSATHSGDGFFLYAGNETVKRTGKGGCNRNKLIENDFSHAVANAIEATFSESNWVLRNRLDDSEHGMWAGYSCKTSISHNRIMGCSHGISIEHGRHNRIEDNAIERCGVGIHLWWDADPDLAGSVYGRSHDLASRGNRIAHNDVLAGVALRLVDDVGSIVAGNRLAGETTALDLGGKTSVRVEGNEVRGRVVEGRPSAPRLRFTGEARATFDGNQWADAPILEGAPEGLALPTTVAIGVGVRRGAIGLPVDVQGVFLPEGSARGRRYIVVDDWGPIDPTKPTVFPKTQSAVGSAQVHVLGAGVSWKVVGLTEGFVAEPTEGQAPATVRIRRTSAAGPTLAPFEAKVRVGEADFVATGTVLSARWKVRWHTWTEDPREDAAAFAALVAGTPQAAVETDALDFSWGGGKPHADVPADRFATVATTTLTLPAGRWTVKTLSDDGVRVKIDRKVVLEDWTWHAPKEGSAVVDLAEGPHDVVVEHFEIDGHAALRFAIEPAR